MSKISVTVEELSELAPFFIGMFTDNPEFISPDAEEFYSKIKKLIKSPLRQHIRNTPEARLLFKRIRSVFTGNSNATITIKADAEPEVKSAKTREQKYLTENYIDSKTRMEKYLI